MKNTFIPKTLPFKTEEWTISKLLLKSSTIDCNPIGQRPSVEKSLQSNGLEPSKAQSIIAAILYGLDICEIKICNAERDQYEKESLDGGHRKRSIIAFMNNEFKLHINRSPYGAVSYEDLPDVAKQFLLKYKLRFVIYGDLTPTQKGQIFRGTNTVTLVKFMEMLNSHGSIPMASCVRNLARMVDFTPDENGRIKNSVHPLLNKTDKGNFTNLAFENKSLIHELMICRVLYRFYQKTNKTKYFGTVYEEDMEKMYEDSLTLTTKQVENLQKNIEEVLDFIYNIATSKKKVMGGKGLSQQEFTFYSRYWFWAKDTFGDFTINDYLKFFKKSKWAMNEVITSEKPITDDKGKRFQSEAFKGYLGLHTNQGKLNKSIEWVNKLFDPTVSGLIPLDPQRTIPYHVRESLLISQEWVCYIDGKPLNMEEAHAAHIEAHSKGGWGDKSNLKMVRAEYNLEMGTTNLEIYKQAKIQELGIAA